MSFYKLAKARTSELERPEKKIKIDYGDSKRVDIAKYHDDLTKGKVKQDYESIQSHHHDKLNHSDYLISQTNLGKTDLLKNKLLSERMAQLNATKYESVQEVDINLGVGSDNAVVREVNQVIGDFIQKISSGVFDLTMTNDLYKLYKLIQTQTYKFGSDLLERYKSYFEDVKETLDLDETADVVRSYSRKDSSVLDLMTKIVGNSIKIIDKMLEAIVSGKSSEERKQILEQDVKNITFKKIDTTYLKELSKEINDMEADMKSKKDKKTQIQLDIMQKQLDELNKIKKELKEVGRISIMPDVQKQEIYRDEISRQRLANMEMAAEEDRMREFNEQERLRQQEEEQIRREQQANEAMLEEEGRMRELEEQERRKEAEKERQRDLERSRQEELRRRQEQKLRDTIERQRELREQISSIQEDFVEMNREFEQLTEEYNRLEPEAINLFKGDTIELKRMRFNRYKEGLQNDNENENTRRQLQRKSAFNNIRRVIIDMQNTQEEYNNQELKYRETSESLLQTISEIEYLREELSAPLPAMEELPAIAGEEEFKADELDRHLDDLAEVYEAVGEAKIDDGVEPVDEFEIPELPEPEPVPAPGKEKPLYTTSEYISSKNEITLLGNSNVFYRNKEQFIEKQEKPALINLLTNLNIDYTKWSSTTKGDKERPLKAFRTKAWDVLKDNPRLKLKGGSHWFKTPK
jgi:DNA repair exonuclease SbcCD ATPase subunit